MCNTQQGLQLHFLCIVWKLGLCSEAWNKPYNIPPPSLLHKSQLYWECSNQLHYSLCNKIRISFRGKLCVWNVVISCTVLCLIAAFSKNLLLFYLLIYLKSLSDYNHVCNLLDSLGCQIYRRANIGHFLVFPDYFILSFFLVDILHKIWSFLTHFFIYIANTIFKSDHPLKGTRKLLISA